MRLRRPARAKRAAFHAENRCCRLIRLVGGTAMSTVKKMPRRIMLDAASNPPSQRTDSGLPDKTEVGREGCNLFRRQFAGNVRHRRPGSRMVSLAPLFQ